MEAKLVQGEVFMVIKPFVLITKKVFKFNGAVVDDYHHPQSFFLVIIICPGFSCLLG